MTTTPVVCDLAGGTISVPASARIVFQLTGWSTSGTVVLLPETVAAESGETILLHDTADIDPPRAYLATAKWYDDVERLQKVRALGQIAPRGSDPVSLSALLSEAPTIPVPDEILAQCIAAAAAADASAKAVADDRVQTGLNAGSAATSATTASAAALAASAARDAVLLSEGLLVSTAQGIGRGVLAVTITGAGTGGTDGTATWVASGGTAVIDATGTATISDGAVVAVQVLQKGLYNADPTGIALTGAGALTGATFALTVGANTPVDGFFSVPVAGSNQAFDLYRVDAGPVATLVVDYPSVALVQEVQAHIVDPYPTQDWDTPTPLNLLANPTSGTTYQLQTFTVANGGRFYAVPTIASLGLAVGDIVRMAFRLIFGTDQPSSFTFRAGTTLISEVAFVLRGGWWIAEAEIPATTTIIRIDWVNSTGADVVFTRPTFAKRLAFQRLGHADRLRLAALASDPGPLGNLWPATATSTKIAGTGDAAEIVVNADGSVSLPADIQVRINGLGINRPVGAVMTVLARASGPLLAMGVRFAGATSGTEAVAMRPAGDGWWVLQSHTIAIGGSTAINEIRIEPDNRNGTTSLFVSAPVTIDRIIVVDGPEIPARLPVAATPVNPAEVGFPVRWQKSGDDLFVYALNATMDRVCQYQFSRVVDSEKNLDGFVFRNWKVGQYVDGVWAETKNLTPLSEISTAVQTQQAIDFTDDPDIFIWGGVTHGQTVHTSINFHADGQTFSWGELSASGSTLGAFTVRVDGYANDEGTTTEALTGSTTCVIAHGHFDKIDGIRFSKVNSVGPAYLAMCPIVDEGFGQIAINDETFDISVTSGNINRSDLIKPRLAVLGEAGMVTFEAINHTGQMAVLVSDRSGDAVPFHKLYLTSGTTAKVSVVAGERRRLHVRYQHFS